MSSFQALRPAAEHNAILERMTSFTLRRDHPDSLTSYDVLKTLAVVLMIVDHVGYYFFPENMWFRVFGRLCVPVWFFLIGYARTRDFPLLWFAGAAFLIFTAPITGQAVFPLNILVTLAVSRLLIDGIMHAALRSHQALLGMMFLLFFLSIPSLAVLEYGTTGFLFAMVGFIMRHRNDILLSRLEMAGFVAVSALAYISVQILLMPALSEPQLLTLFGGMAAVCAALWMFRPAALPSMTERAAPLSTLLMLGGRWTIEIYIGHVVLFRILAAVIDPERFQLFHLVYMPPALQAFFLSN